MIERLYFKDNLTFKELELEFNKGLIVFSGSSGAGKSVIFKSILAALGMEDVYASVLELSIDEKITLDSIENQTPNIFKVKKDKQVRYFINNQAISKKMLSESLNKKIRYLSARNYDDFSADYLLQMLDQVISKYDIKFKEILDKFYIVFKDLQKSKQELKKLEEDEEKLNDLKDYLNYEIAKIKSINPKIGEFEELLEIKTKLSKRDKTEHLLEKANGIFSYEGVINELLRLNNIDSSFFNAAISELNDIFAKLSDYDDEQDIENILNRLEKLQSLNKKYGSIENAIEVLKNKELELKKYENIEFEKQELENKVKNLLLQADDLAINISSYRNKYLVQVNEKINEYLKDLYLDKVLLNLQNTELTHNGTDMLILNLNKANFKDVSSGELNRLRLAFLATFTNFLQDGGGYIFLDEIDANLSGKEVSSVANVISELSKHYQIFAITHMPWICARANQHFLVSKNNNISTAKEIKGDEIVNELARMISDENISEYAIEFAKSLV